MSWHYLHVSIAHVFEINSDNPPKFSGNVQTGLYFIIFASITVSLIYRFSRRIYICAQSVLSFHIKFITERLKSMSASSFTSALLTKGNNFCDFLFASLNEKYLLNESALLANDQLVEVSILSVDPY